MIVTTRQSDRLQASDVELLALVSQQLSQALERQKLYNIIRRLTRELVVFRKREEKLGSDEQLRTP